MTKLMEWLFGGFLFVGAWSALLFNPTDLKIIDEYRLCVLLLPVIVVGLFGIYAASVVLWRVFTFNNCEEAAKELQKEIQEAREDLKRKGFIFDEQLT
ncbi:dolichyl-phosphate mannosyltransferase subunit 3 [Lycorma delicatula]|uniref:dolichyl-phosphate mannosyltransferase subunit 3 n=1 Tax=Lycorma delicatula TaxID=130591 RepID=UPI003F5171E6